MTLWHLLWLFLSANGASLLMLVTPVLFTWGMAGHERSKWRFFDWRTERRRRLEIERYGRPLEPCLYCGTECCFAEGCANHDLAVAAQASRREARLLGELPNVRERAARYAAELPPRGER